jgi:hypothetical protein
MANGGAAYADLNVGLIGPLAKQRLGGPFAAHLELECAVSIVGSS